MKKLLLFCLLVFPLKVGAANGFLVTEMPYVICDEDNNQYKVHFTRYNYYSIYFLNLNQNYNYNFADYVEYEEEESDFYKKYLWVMPVVNYQTFYNYHEQFMTRLLWEKMYPDKTFFFCGESNRIINQKESEYEEVRLRVEKVITGIDLFQEEHSQFFTEVGIYYDPYLPFYDLYDDQGLEVTIQNDLMKISGIPGEYHLIFRLIDNNAGEEKYFTDGINKLATFPHSPTTDYIMNLIIHGYELNINFANHEKKEVCLKVVSQDQTLKKCTNEEHLSFEVSDGDYQIILENSFFFEDFEEEITVDGNQEVNITLELKKVINENDEITPDEEEVVILNSASDENDFLTFVAKDTFINSD